SPRRVLREEAHGDAVVAGRRQLGGHRGAEELVRQLEQDAGAVAGAGIASGGAAVGQVGEDLQRLRDRLVAGDAVEPGDASRTAGVVLEGRIVEALLLGQRHCGEWYVS